MKDEDQQKVVKYIQNLSNYAIFIINNIYSYSLI